MCVYLSVPDIGPKDLNFNTLLLDFEREKSKNLKLNIYPLFPMARISKYPDTFIILRLIYSKCSNWFVITSKWHSFNLKWFLLLCHLKTLCENVYSKCNRSNFPYGYSGYIRKFDIEQFCTWRKIKHSIGKCKMC